MSKREANEVLRRPLGDSGTFVKDAWDAIASTYIHASDKEMRQNKKMFYAGVTHMYNGLVQAANDKAVDLKVWNKRMGLVAKEIDAAAAQLKAEEITTI